MKQRDFELLISTGTIEAIVIFRPRGSTEGWAVVCETNRQIPYSEYLETAKGETRFFATIDTAHGVIRKAGFEAMVTIDG